MKSYKIITITDCVAKIVSAFRKCENEEFIVNLACEASKRLEKYPDLFSSQAHISYKHWNEIVRLGGKYKEQIPSEKELALMVNPYFRQFGSLSHFDEEDAVDVDDADDEAALCVNDINAEYKSILELVCQLKGVSEISLDELCHHFKLVGMRLEQLTILPLPDTSSERIKHYRFYAALTDLIVKLDEGNMKRDDIMRRLPPLIGTAITLGRQP